MTTPRHHLLCRPQSRALLIAGIGMLCGLLCVWSEVSAQPPAVPAIVSREYKTKAEVLSVLGKFVAWPEAIAPSRARPLTIGVLGKDPFFEAGVNQLDQVVAAEKAKGRLMTVHRFDSAKDYQRCHILFVSNTAAEKSVERTLADRVAAAKKLTDGEPVLLVGQSPGLALQGCTANLLYDRTTNFIRLELNPDAAQRANLKPAPDLMRLKLVDIIRDKS